MNSELIIELVLYLAGLFVPSSSFWGAWSFETSRGWMYGWLARLAAGMNVNRMEMSKDGGWTDFEEEKNWILSCHFFIVLFPCWMEEMMRKPFFYDKLMILFKWAFFVYHVVSHCISFSHSFVHSVPAFRHSVTHSLFVFDCSILALIPHPCHVSQQSHHPLRTGQQHQRQQLHWGWEMNKLAFKFIQIEWCGQSRALPCRCCRCSLLLGVVKRLCRRLLHWWFVAWWFNEKRFAIR